VSFREWWSWFADLHWSLKWFPLLVALRPVVDNFYFLKDISPFLSPLYIVGVLTPVLSITALFYFKMPGFSKTDKAFFYWSLALILSCVLLLFYDPFSLLSIEFVLKLSLPVYLYFFLRVFITDLRDLHGILQSFLYAGIFVAIILLYEVLVNPIRIEESRGLDRIQGNFGDVVSYGMYIIFTFIVASYFFLSRQHILSLNRRLWLLIPVSILGLIGLFNIHHTATYSIFVLLIGTFLTFNLKSKNQPVAIAIVILAVLVTSYWGNQIISENIEPLLETDLAVYSGEQDSDKLLHGRVGRWRMMLQLFSSESVAVQFLGFPLTFDYVYQFVGIGSHNDFIRILFATGILGLVLYLNFISKIFSRASGLGVAQRYLVYTVLFALILYSVSVTPTFYAPFMYFALTVFAFLALDEKEMIRWKDHEY
jgi:hypothetical protein